MTADPGVEYMPAPSLKRLQAQLDALESPVAANDAAERAPPARRGRDLPWRFLAAASVVSIAATIGLVVLDNRPTAPPSLYHTVTTPAALVPDAVIRAVFMPSLTLVELQKLLDEAQLRIVAGPTEAGVYSLAANTARPVSVSLEMLRRHDTVRFAESTQPSAAGTTDIPR
jgi:hypothetical protein